MDVLYLRYGCTDSPSEAELNKRLQCNLLLHRTTDQPKKKSMLTGLPPLLTLLKFTTLWKTQYKYTARACMSESKNVVYKHSILFYSLATDYIPVPELLNNDPIATALLPSYCLSKF